MHNAPCGLHAAANARLLQYGFGSQSAVACQGTRAHCVTAGYVNANHGLHMFGRLLSVADGCWQRHALLLLMKLFVLHVCPLSIRADLLWPCYQPLSYRSLGDQLCIDC